MTTTNNYTICALIHARGSIATVSHFHHLKQLNWVIYTTPLTFTRKCLLLFSNYSQFFTV